MPKQKIFQLQIVTPKGTVFSGPVIHVNAPGRHGRFGVLVDHIPAIIQLGVGNVTVQAVGEDIVFAIRAGVAHVQDDNTMKIITPSAEQLLFV